ncbi:MAG: PAS domain S-box protein, partial [Ignavibacteriales bacterium]
MKPSSKSSVNTKSTKNKMPKEKYDKYRSLYENHPLIHITIDLDGKIKSVNESGALELGYEVNELINSNISNLFIPQDAVRIKKQIQYVLLNPAKQSSHEMKMLRKNKQEFWVRETIYTAKDDVLINEVFFVFDNITYQKNAEANAKSLAQSLQNMLDASPLGVLVYRLDENGDLILISTNQSAVNILQIDVYALISKKIQDIFPSLLNNNIINKFFGVINTGQPLLNQNLYYEDIHFNGIYEFSVMKLSDST